MQQAPVTGACRSNFQLQWPWSLVARLCSRSRDDILGVRIPNEDDNGNSPMVFRCFKWAFMVLLQVFLCFIHGMILWNEVGWSSTKPTEPQHGARGPDPVTRTFIFADDNPSYWFKSPSSLLNLPIFIHFSCLKTMIFRGEIQDCTWHGQASLRAKRRILSRNLQVLRAPKVRPSALRRWDGHHFTGKTSSLHDSVLPFYTTIYHIFEHEHSFTFIYLHLSAILTVTRLTVFWSPPWNQPYRHKTEIPLDNPPGYWHPVRRSQQGYSHLANLRIYSYGQLIWRITKILSIWRMNPTAEMNMHFAA